MTPEQRQDYIGEIKAQLARLAEDLAPLESGEMQLFERKGDDPWEEITQDMIANYKRNIATYESILAALQNEQ